LAQQAAPQPLALKLCLQPQRVRAERLVALLLAVPQPVGQVLLVVQQQVEPVVPQEALLEVLEALLAEQPVVRRLEAQPLVERLLGVLLPAQETSLED
jgi:hypothetical protein